MKPGAIFVSYEWVSTPKFDPSSPDQVEIMDEIIYGNGLPVCQITIISYRVVKLMTSTLILGVICPCAYPGMAESLLALCGKGVLKSKSRAP